MEKKEWQKNFEQILPLLGHRNWILIVDKAFPLQSAQGMNYINTGSPLLEVAGSVLAKIEQSSHVKAIVYTDSELNYMNEELVPQIDTFRNQLHQLTGKYNVQTLNHEDIFKKLDEASKLFRVVILKTEQTIPYSSIFIELDCGYWSPEKEGKLRSLISETLK